jgi:hypothetical protein
VKLFQTRVKNKLGFSRAVGFHRAFDSCIPQALDVELCFKKDSGIPQRSIFESSDAILERSN